MKSRGYIVYARPFMGDYLVRNILEDKPIAAFKSLDHADAFCKKMEDERMNNNMTQYISEEVGNYIASRVKEGIVIPLEEKADLTMYVCNYNNDEIIMLVSSPQIHGKRWEAVVNRNKGTLKITEYTVENEQFIYIEKEVQ